MADLRTECFVIMPYGVKEGVMIQPSDAVDGGAATGGGAGETAIARVDFDAVYRDLIAPAVEAAGFAPRRSDEQGGGRLIIDHLYEQLCYTPIAIADGTLCNPNVFYEIGLRHAVRPSTTLLIHAEGTLIPYDLKDVPFYAYPTESVGGVLRIPADCRETVVARLAQFIRDGAKMMHDGFEDSPFFTTAIARTGTSRIIREHHKLHWPLSGAPGALGIASGDLEKIRGIDAWANSENEFFDMARTVENSVSSAIRRLSRPDRAIGPVPKDQDPVFAELTNKARLRSTQTGLNQVIDTAAGRLGRDNGVKRIFHVATASVGPRGGFEPSQDVHHTIGELVRAVDRYNRRRWRKSGKMATLLVPLFGAGQGGRRPESLASQLVSGAIAALREIAETTKKNRQPALTTVYFLAREKFHYEMMVRVLSDYVDQGALEAPTEPPPRIAPA